MDRVAYVLVLVSSRQIVNVPGVDLAVGIHRQEESADPRVNLAALQTLQEIIYDFRDRFPVDGRTLRHVCFLCY